MRTLLRFLTYSRARACVCAWQNRVVHGWLGRAIFLFPIAIATAFTFGLSWLILPCGSPT